MYNILESTPQFHTDPLSSTHRFHTRTTFSYFLTIYKFNWRCRNVKRSNKIDEKWNDEYKFKKSQKSP